MEHPSQVGKYKIEKFLGGGMSNVYRATDTVLGRVVAIKILKDQSMADPEAKARFLEEARTASKLSHENIINVFDFGEADGKPFMVMEFLEGESLRDAIKHKALGALERKLRIAIQVGRAIDYIHTRKIIHRDIKPENINVDLTGKAKLMDFGIAKSEGVSLTRAGFTVGTPFYMAPEQVLGRPLTPQADIYSFGVVLFEMLTGQKPITEQTVEKIFQQVIYQPLPLEPLQKAGVPQEVSDIIVRTTAKQVNQRPLNLGVVCDELERTINSGSNLTGNETRMMRNPNSGISNTSRIPNPPSQNNPPRPVIQAPAPMVRPAEPVSSEPSAGNLLKSPAVLMVLGFVGMLLVVFLIYAVLVRLKVL